MTTENTLPTRNGVRLRLFEQVVGELLPKVRPTYSKLPAIDEEVKQIITSSVQENEIFAEKMKEDTNIKWKEEKEPEWPFAAMPLDAGVRHTSNSTNTRTTGKLKGMRAVKKEWQLRSLIQCVLAMLPQSALGQPDEDNETRKIRIVDFAGGSGHLALPLSVLLPKCEIVLVDLKEASLDLAFVKAKKLANLNPAVDIDKEEMSDPEEENISRKERNKRRKKLRRKMKETNDYPSVATKDPEAVTIHENVLKQSEDLPNLFTYHGSIQNYAEEHGQFDIGLGLHACGEATDLVLRACGKAKANFVVSPCCVGKLSQQKRNPYIYHATAANEATISYPQSSMFCTIIPKGEKFDALAKAADYGEMENLRTPRNASRRTAKSLLEMDRLLYMKETYGYDDVVLCRFDPWEASAKNDVLVGWMKVRDNGVGSPYKDLGNQVQTCEECYRDVDMTMSQLLDNHSSEEKRENTCFDWSKEEENIIEKQLEEFLGSPDFTFTFPTGMGKRKRRLIHHTAERMRIHHYSIGDKNSEKTVIVDKKEFV